MRSSRSYQKARKLLWDFVTIAAVAGVIYGTIEYIEYAGPWQALVAVPLLAVLGYLAVEIIYPIWFRNGH